MRARGRADAAAAPTPPALRMLLVDNYDSFTYNLVHQIAGATGRAPDVVPNDWDGWEPSVLDGYDAVVLSPGPGDPQVPADFGICAAVIRLCAEHRIPLLGVCLGHQGLAHAFGARVVRAPEPRHGRPSPVAHDGAGPFAGLPSPLEVVRYHSLMVEDVPEELVVTAHADDGVIMGLRHRELPLWGVQFHPESIGTPEGTRMLANFAAFAAEQRRDRLPRASASEVPLAGGPEGPSGVDSAPTHLIEHRELPLRVEPSVLFTGLFGRAAQAVWLDGNRPGDPRARFSILGGGDDLPTATADVRTGTVMLRAAADEQMIRTGLFDWLEGELARRHAPVPGLPFALGWVGALGYELRAETGSAPVPDSPTPDALLLRLDRAIVVDHERERIHLLALDAAWVDETMARIRDLETSAGIAADPAVVPGLAWTARHSREDYLALVAAAQREIAAGETYEVCLTNMLHADPDPAFDPLAAYLVLREQNPAPFGAFLRIDGVTVLSTSPERFLRITPDGAVSSSPIKGTRPRGETAEDDSRIRAELAGSEKDRAENLMIVDLVRHDLGRTAELGSVHVDGLFRVESYATVHQLVSTVRSTLRDSPVAAVRAAFPPGSMTGAPKRRTMTILDRLEEGARGLYSGALGYFSFDGGVDLSVVIRTLVVHDAGLDYGVGGAIVSLSGPEEEYAETVVKARPLLRLTGAVFPEG